MDAHSGALLYSLNMKEYEFYTVMFAVSRTLGCMADTIWDRALGMKLEYTESIDFHWIE